MQEFIKGVGAGNARDIAATNLRYLLLYLRVAKDKHPDYWAKIKAESKLRELVLTQFLRTAYWLEKSAPFTGKLGSPDADRITAARTAARSAEPDFRKDTFHPSSSPDIQRSCLYREPRSPSKSSRNFLRFSVIRQGYRHWRRLLGRLL
ncbi:hypothetical protein ACH35V_24495 [Actinomadura sp. 1N219]|uniref:hypothetical protein n=1 Tax=Actinomadura sp. 1N219 TaxID=3375152 RepID=UPI00378D1C30